MSKELIDQSAHFASNMLFTILVFVPVLNCLVVLLWAYTREYYQHKDESKSFWGNIPDFNRDLFWSSIGIAVGLLISGAVWAFLLIGLRG